MKIFKSFVIFFSLFISYFAFGEKTLIACTSQAPLHFDPALATDTETMDAGAFSVFDRLMVVEYGSDLITPSLAKSWSLGEDLKSFTLELRDDVSFHSNEIFQPSRNFNADDVIYTFERQLNPDHPWYNIFEEEFQYFKSLGMDKSLLKIEKIDDYTVKFYLRDFDASFIAKLTMGFLSIHSKEYMEQLLAQGDTEKLKTHPIGTGPWIYDSYDQTEQKINYIANPDYFAGKPNIDRLIFDITLDEEERRQKLEEGACHHISSPIAGDIKALQQSDGYEVINQAGFNIYYLEFNTSVEPLNNKNVRKALAMAIDKDYLAKEARGNTAIAAKNPISPKMWSYNKSIVDYPYNPELAKNLLVSSGYPKGLTLQYLIAKPDVRDEAKILEIVQRYWDNIGVKLEVIEVPVDRFFNRKAEKIQYDVAFGGWGMDINDPDNVFYNLLSCSSMDTLNNSNWCHEEFDSVITQAKHESDYEKRVELYQEAQEIFHEEMPWIPVFHMAFMEVISKKLKNYEGKVFGNQKFPPHILELE